MAWPHLYDEMERPVLQLGERSLAKPLGSLALQTKSRRAASRNESPLDPRCGASTGALTPMATPLDLAVIEQTPTSTPRAALRPGIATWTLLFFLLSALGAAAAQAQEEASSAGESRADVDAASEVEPEADPDLLMPEGIEIITVTAEKRASSLQETPMAITALTGAELFNRGIYDVEALASQVPNFHYGEAFGLSRITIRGISVQGFNDPATAFHIDGVYQNNPTAASALTFYDVGQIEVLRGPQGTLWGRNSTAGSINVSTRQPVHEFELFGDVMYGAYSQTFARGVVNVPVVQDTVASRVAFYVDKRDGYQENLFIPGKDQDANDADNWGIRPQVLFQVTDDLSVTARGSYNHQGGVGFSNRIVGDYPPYEPGPFLDLPVYLLGTSAPFIWVNPYRSIVDDPNDPAYGRVRPNPKNARKIRADADRFQDVSTWDVNGTVNWDFYDVPMLGDVTFNAVAGYKEETRRQRIDVDLTEQDLFAADLAAHSRDRVLDVHLRNSGDTSTDWLLGFFLLDADSKLSIDLPGAQVYTGDVGYVCLFNPNCVPTGIAGFGLANQIVGLDGVFVGGENESLSIAGYAHVSQDFFEEQFNVGLGLRYNYDSKTGLRQGGRVTANALGLSSCVQPGYDANVTDRWDGVTGDLKAEFLPSDSHMVYGSISRGYKPGTINGDSVSTNCNEPAVPVPNAKHESIWAFEVGSKNQFFDDTLVANLTGFYYLYDNLQVLEQANQVTVTQNAKEARVWGIEFEGIWRPIESLTLSAIYGYLHAYYEDYFGYDFATGEFGDFSGNQMIRAPKHSGTLSADYVYWTNTYGSFTSRIQYFVSDDVFFSAAGRKDDRQSAYGLLQVRLRWDNPTQNFFIETFVENITDEDIRSTRGIGQTLLDRPQTASYEPPRTWGVRIGGSF